MTPGRLAARIALTYAIVSIVYIVASDRVVAAVAPSAEDSVVFQTMKGIGFVLATATGIWWLVRRGAERIRSEGERVRRAEVALVESDRRAAVATLAASSAHDFRNLLTVVGATGDMLASMPGLPSAASPLVDHLRRATEQGTSIATQLAQTGRDADPSLRVEVDLAAEAVESVRLLGVHRAVRACRVRVDAPPSAPAFVQPALLRQALMNLVINAAEAAPGGAIEVRVSARDGDAVLEVHDDGPGVPASMRDRIFEDYVTTKEGGTGLGLLSVRCFADLHGGTARADSSPLGGAAFSVRWPAAAASSGP